MEIYRLTIVYFENNHEQVPRNMFVASGSGCENVSPIKGYSSFARSETGDRYKVSISCFASFML